MATTGGGGIGSLQFMYSKPLLATWMSSSKDPRRQNDEWIFNTTWNLCGFVDSLRTPAWEPWLCGISGLSELRAFRGQTCQDLPEVMKYLHSHGVKAYVALAPGGVRFARHFFGKQECQDCIGLHEWIVTPYATSPSFAAYLYFRENMFLGPT